MADEDASAQSAREPWHFDKRIPIALIAALLLQTAGMVAWAARLDTRVGHLESQTGAGRGDRDRLTRLEVKLDALSESMARVERPLDRSEDRRAR